MQRKNIMPEIYFSTGSDNYFAVLHPSFSVRETVLRSFMLSSLGQGKMTGQGVSAIPFQRSDKGWGGEREGKGRGDSKMK